MLLVGDHVLERLGRADLVVPERQLAQRRSGAVGPPPLRQDPAAFEHFARFQLRLRPAVAPRARTVGIFRRAALFDRQQRQMQVAARASGGFDEDGGGGGIRALQRGESEFGLSVGVLEEIDDLRRRVASSGPFAEQRRGRRLFALVARRRERAAFAAPRQVVDQREPATRRHRQDLVNAIGVERGESDFGRVGGAHIELRLASAVTHDQFAAAANRGQHDHQRGEHAGRLLGVAMAGEEAAFVIDQQLVELGLDRVLDAEPLADAGQHRLQRLRPMLAGDLHLPRLDLPGAPHVGIIDRFRAAAERRRGRGRDELLGLKRQQRQRDLADALHR